MTAQFLVSACGKFLIYHPHFILRESFVSDRPKLNKKLPVHPADDSFSKEKRTGFTLVGDAKNKLSLDFCYRTKRMSDGSTVRRYYIGSIQFAYVLERANGTFHTHLIDDLAPTAEEFKNEAAMNAWMIALVTGKLKI